MPDEDELPLIGGNASHGVVRVGDTVRRPGGAWSPSVDAFLRHLEAVGFARAPRSYGFDERGRHVLEFIDGPLEASGADPGPRVDVTVLGAVLRDLHDAAADFVVPPGATWHVEIKPNATDLVTHNDVAPWNLVHGARGVVLIDWDSAGPGSRLWDLAYAANAFAPLAPGVDVDLAGQRVRAIARGYRLDEPGRAELADLLVPRIMSMYELLRVGHEQGREPWRRLWVEGHGSTWRGFATYATSHATALRRALLEDD